LLKNSLESLITMKFRNSWKNHKPGWKTITIRLRISLVDIFSLELDPARNFYSITLLNFTIKNR
jgi:hypothetical protein